MVEVKKYVFIAGGIGITPFRSIIQDVVDKNQKEDIILIYQAKDEDAFLFKEVFARAEKSTNLVTHYLANTHLSKEQIIELVPDFPERDYMISGPQPFVEQNRDLLSSMGVSFDRIKTDLFTGYA